MTSSGRCRRRAEAVASMSHRSKNDLSLTRNSTSWEKMFDQEGSYGLAVGPVGQRLAIAAQNGAYFSQDAGTTWQRLGLPKREKLSSALFLENREAVFGA